MGLVALADLQSASAQLLAATTDEHRRDYVGEAERIRAGERLLFGGHARLPVPIAYGRDPATGFDWPAAPAAELAMPPDVDVKGVWELGKLAEPARLAWLGRLLDRPDDVRFATDEALRFLAEHPVGIGPHWLSPLEVSIRLVSLLWILTCRDAERGEASVETTALIDAAAAHLDFLYDERSVFRDPNNHVIGEAVGLLLGGLVLPGLPAAATYVEEGMRILGRELPRQLDAGGYGREASTDYHREVVEWLLQAALALRRLAPSERNLPDEHLERALRSSVALAEPTPPCPSSATPTTRGSSPSARLRAPTDASSRSTARSAARAHRRSERPTIPCWRSPSSSWAGHRTTGPRTPGHRPEMQPKRAPGAFSAPAIPPGSTSTSRPPAPDCCPIVATRIPICWRCRCRRRAIPRVTDAGTHRYGTSASRRYILRSARHHATLYLPPDQADPLDLFKWATHPVAGPSYRCSAEDVDILCGSHDGYARSRPGAVHRREVVRIAGDCVLVIDRVGGRGSTLVVFPYPLGPEARKLTPTALGAGGAITYDDGTIVTIVSPHPELRSVRRRGGPHGSHSPRYGDLLPVHALELVGRIALPLYVVTLLHVATAGTSTPREMRVDRPGRRVHIGIGRGDEPAATQREIEYVQHPDGTRLVRVSERGGIVSERTLKLPVEWDAE